MSSSEDVDVWMPLYVALWDATTGHLTNEQDGAYGRLVRWYWKNQRPPADDDAELASICRTDVKTWRKIRVKLAPFFTISAGFWTHDKVERTMLEWKERRAKAKESASNAANTRWQKARRETIKADAKRNAPRIADAMPMQCPSASTTEVKALTGPITLCERDAPISPLEGQSAIAPDETLEDRRRLAEEVRRSVGIVTRRASPQQ
jgi:uncharacterized protein YdaU (DUF1376 family)